MERFLTPCHNAGVKSEFVWRSGRTVVESAANGRKAKRKDGLTGRRNWDSGCFGIDGLDEEPAL